MPFEINTILYRAPGTSPFIELIKRLDTRWSKNLGTVDPVSPRVLPKRLYPECCSFVKASRMVGTTGGSGTFPLRGFLKG
jgi:hypothetical protein